MAYVRKLSLLAVYLRGSCAERIGTNFCDHILTTNQKRNGSFSFIATKVEFTQHLEEACK